MWFYWNSRWLSRKFLGGLIQFFYRPARGLAAIFAAGGRLSIIAARPAGYVGGSGDYEWWSTNNVTMKMIPLITYLVCKPVSSDFQPKTFLIQLEFMTSSSRSDFKEQAWFQIIHPLEDLEHFNQIRSKRSWSFFYSLLIILKYQYNWF